MISKDSENQQQKQTKKPSHERDSGKNIEPLMLKGTYYTYTFWNNMPLPQTSLLIPAGQFQALFWKSNNKEWVQMLPPLKEYMKHHEVQHMTAEEIFLISLVRVKWKICWIHNCLCVFIKARWVYGAIIFQLKRTDLIHQGMVQRPVEWYHGIHT